MPSGMPHYHPTMPSDTPHYHPYPQTHHITTLLAGMMAFVLRSGAIIIAFNNAHLGRTPLTVSYAHPMREWMRRCSCCCVCVCVCVCVCCVTRICVCCANRVCACYVNRVCVCVFLFYFPLPALTQVDL